MALFKPPALTTVFVPPSSCLGPPNVPTTGPDGYLYWQFNPSTFEGAFTSCYPPNYREAWQSGLDVYYSPGVCPKGYTARLSLVQDETAGLCCQSGWTANTIWRDYCYQTHLGRQIWAPGVSIRYKPSDIALLATATATPTGPNGIPLPTADPSNTIGLPDPTDDPKFEEIDGGGSGMSRSTKIGLGVGIPVLVAIIALFAVIFFMKRREERRAAASENMEAGVAVGGSNPPAYASTDQKMGASQEHYAPPPPSMSQTSTAPQTPFVPYPTGAVEAPTPAVAPTVVSELAGSEVPTTAGSPAAYPTYAPTYTTAYR